MYDAVMIADRLTRDEAIALQRKEARMLVLLGEAQRGRCVGIREWPDGYAVYVGMQDGEPVKEPPMLRRTAS